MRLFALVAFLALTCLVASPALAADQVIEGKVVKAADSKLTFTDKDNKEHVLTVAADAKITLDGKVAKLEELKAGFAVKATTPDGKAATVIASLSK